MFLKVSQHYVLAGRAREEEATQQFNEGLLSEEERYKKVLEIWEQTKLDIEKLIPATLDTKGSVYDMVTIWCPWNDG
jgi:hypothetical protein